jgi:hypothetical protein
MSALFYRLLGRAVWTILLRYLRRKNGRLLLPRKMVLGGVGVIVLGIVLGGIGVARRSGGSSGQLRA